MYSGNRSGSHTEHILLFVIVASFELPREQSQYGLFFRQELALITNG
jgi:hypothetical protein